MKRTFSGSCIPGRNFAAACLQTGSLTSEHDFEGRGCWHRSQDKRLNVLEQSVRRQEDAILQLKLHQQKVNEEKQIELQQLLLAAHRLSQLVEDFVFQGSDTGELISLSMKTMFKRYRKGHLSSAQAQRWEQVITLLPAGVTSDKFAETDTFLRQHGWVGPDDNREEMQQTKVADLMQWADAHVSARAIWHVRQYITFLNKFSSHARPLCQIEMWHTFCSQHELAPPVLCLALRCAAFSSFCHNYYSLHSSEQALNTPISSASLGRLLLNMYQIC